MPSLFERAATALIQGRSGDGFGPTPGADPEPEPTALAAIALDDDDARRWLLGAQRADGSFGLDVGEVRDHAATALCALALPPGEARERALDHVLATPAERVASDDSAPRDADLVGWGWTLGTAGWVEPTARAVHTLRRLRPSEMDAIGAGIGYLDDRECLGGGWNHGNPLVYDVPIPPYGQTTAVALAALHGAGSAVGLIHRGVGVLRRLWPEERGPLTLAVSLAAFRLLGLPDAAQVEVALDEELGRTEPAPDAVALAWAAIASGPGLSALVVPS